MLRLALTGSIATGKSTVLGVFAEHDIPAYSSDEAVHELYQREAVPAVETLFPGVTRDGAIDREALSRAVMGQPERLAELESVVHPLVREKIFAFFDDAEAQGADLAIVEVPLLYETGSTYPVDRIIVTHCAPELQRQRAMARPNMTEEKFAAVLARQTPQAEKIARADHAIDTGRPIAETREEIAALVRSLRTGADGPL